MSKKKKSESQGPIIKYRTRWATYRLEIERVECVRETDKFVTITIPSNSWSSGGTRREAKQSDDQNYFDTWEDAYNWLLEIAEIKINNARRRLAGANENFRKVEKLKEKGE